MVYEAKTLNLVPINNSDLKVFEMQLGVKGMVTLLCLESDSWVVCLPPLWLGTEFPSDR